MRSPPPQPTSPPPLLEQQVHTHTQEARKYLHIALVEARKSPPKPTNFCVGACLVWPSAPTPQQQLLGTGYTLESPGNTHAEQSCFLKLAQQRFKCAPEDLGKHLPPDCVLYTTMEPCNKRSPGNLPCVDRILRLRRKDGDVAIRKVFVGAEEPETFVGTNEGRRRLEEAGIEVVLVAGLEEEILKVATAGHVKDEDEKKKLE